MLKMLGKYKQYISLFLMSCYRTTNLAFRVGVKADTYVKTNQALVRFTNQRDDLKVCKTNEGYDQYTVNI